MNRSPCRRLEVEHHVDAVAAVDRRHEVQAGQEAWRVVLLGSAAQRMACSHAKAGKQVARTVAVVLKLQASRAAWGGGSRVGDVGRRENCGRRGPQGKANRA